MSEKLKICEHYPDLIPVDLSKENLSEKIMNDTNGWGVDRFFECSGAVKAYVGGANFSKSNFDRVALSYPQSGSSFKPFIYAAALANEYNLFSLVNDAPIAFEDKNLESVWRPENYTGKFYGPTSVRDALINSLNIVSIKLLRGVGINIAQNYLQNFGTRNQDFLQIYL